MIKKVEINISCIIQNEIEKYNRLFESTFFNLKLFHCLAYVIYLKRHP